MASVVVAVSARWNMVHSYRFAPLRAVHRKHHGNRRSNKTFLGRCCRRTAFFVYLHGAVLTVNLYAFQSSLNRLFGGRLSQREGSRRRLHLSEHERELPIAMPSTCR